MMSAGVGLPEDIGGAGAAFEAGMLTLSLAQGTRKRGSAARL
jgi:hypothetical protein